MHELQFFPGLVQTGMAGQILEIKEWAKSLEFRLWQGKKNAIADWPSFKVSALPRQQWFGMHIWHDKRSTHRRSLMHSSKMHS